MLLVFNMALSSLISMKKIFAKFSRNQKIFAGYRNKTSSSNE